MGPFGVECGNLEERGGKLFQNLLDMRWVMGHRLVFGMMWCGDQPLKTSYSDLLNTARSKDA